MREHFAIASEPAIADTTPEPLEGDGVSVQHMSKRTRAQSNASRAYAAQALQQHRHKRRRAALGRKLNMPTDKAALRTESDKLVLAWARKCRREGLFFVNDESQED